MIRGQGAVHKEQLMLNPVDGPLSPLPDRMIRLSKLAKAVMAVGIVGLASKAAWDWYTVLPPGAMNDAQYVGRTTCAKCHQAEQARWHGSHHDRPLGLAT